MNTTKTRLYAWLGKWGDELSADARAEFRDAVQDDEVVPLVTDTRVRVVPPTKAPPVKRAINPSKPCKRGEMTVDEGGAPFRHAYDKTLGYCVFCGDGAPEPVPDPNANLLLKGGRDRAWCGEHGCFHDFEVRPDGSIVNPPDCEMFKKTATEVQE